MTQKKIVLKELILDNKITALYMQNKYGIMRLAARISELREAHDEIIIKTTMIAVKNRFGKIVHVAQYELTHKD